MKDEKYFYLVDYDIYARCSNGIFYKIINNKEYIDGHSYLLRIDFGELYADEISKEEYYAQLR